MQAGSPTLLPGPSIARGAPKAPPVGERAKLRFEHDGREACYTPAVTVAHESVVRRNGEAGGRAT